MIVKQLRNIVGNVWKLGLFRAFFRKLLPSFKGNEIPSDSALLYYEANAKSDREVADLLGVPWRQLPLNSEQQSLLSPYDQLANSEFKRKRNRPGGVGAIDFLYSVVGGLKPSRCLECGVSMGGSSLAILTALHENGGGKLYSNDLPYLWHDDPLEVVGALVRLSDLDLSVNWELSLGDDKDNLPSMLSREYKFGFMHYDSNKYSAARNFFWDSVKDKVEPAGIVVFDDIQNNDMFCVVAKGLQENQWASYIIKYREKYVGVLQRTAGKA